MESEWKTMKNFPYEGVQKTEAVKFKEKRHSI